MPSPLPGMDPFLESQGFWQDFHTNLLTYCRELVNASLPVHYVALIEERISLVDLTGEAPAGFRPDVSIIREERVLATPKEQGGVATLEPVAVPLARKDLDEVPERWIEIKRLPDLALVTVIEILSPTNKSGLGRGQYLQKRRELLDQPVHLVEIDLLLGGKRLPMGGRLPPGDYYGFVSRAENARLPTCTPGRSAGPRRQFRSPYLRPTRISAWTSPWLSIGPTTRGAITA